MRFIRVVESRFKHMADRRRKKHTQLLTERGRRNVLNGLSVILFVDKKEIAPASQTILIVKLVDRDERKIAVGKIAIHFVKRR